MDVTVVVLTTTCVHFVVSAMSLPDNLRATVLKEATSVLGEYSSYRCDDHQDSHGKPVCSCDPSCNRYGDCCIDVAQEVPRERYMCTQLERHGRYVWAKASCIGRATPQQAAFKCEGRFTNDVPALSYIVAVPVYHRGTLYRNIYCVLCNNRSTREIYRWHSRLEWIGRAPANLSSGRLLTQMVYNVERRVYGIELDGVVYNITFRAAEFQWDNFTQAFNTTECSPVIDTCPEGSDPVLVRKCELYAAYYTPNNTVGVSYKNYHCALCNGVTLETIAKDCERRAHLQPFIPLSTAGVRAFEEATPELVGASYFEFLYDPSMTDSGCDEHEIKVPGLNSCQPLRCPKGARWHRSGKCIGPGATRSCPWVVYKKKWVTILPNRSLYLNFSGEIYGPSDYEADSWKGHVLVCVSHPAAVVLDPTQEVVTEVCVAFSISCLLLLIAVYVSLPHLRARAAGRAILCTSTSLVLAQGLFVVFDDIPPRTTSCKLVAVALHFSYLASFFWRNAIAIDVCRSLATDVFDHGSEHLFLWYSGYAWLSPALLVGAAVLLDVFLGDAVLSPNYGSSVCFICRRASLFVFFLAPVATLLVANTVLLIVTARSLRSSSLATAANRGDGPGISFLLYVKLVVAFGLTWILGFVATLTSIRWVWYPFIVMTALQGVYLFFAFACKKAVIRDLRERFCPRKRAKKAARKTSRLPTVSTAVHPLFVTRSVRKTNTRGLEVSTNTQC